MVRDLGNKKRPNVVHTEKIETIDLSIDLHESDVVFNADHALYLGLI